MSKTYYYEPAPGTPQIISDWDNYEEDSWSETRYVKFFGTNYFLVPAPLTDSLSFEVNLNEPFTVHYQYKPLWRDPGDHVDDEFRYHWMQTQYAPHIELQATFLPDRDRSVICSSFLDTTQDYVGPPDDTSNLFSGEFSGSDFARLTNKPIRVHLDVSDDPMTKLYLEGADPAVFVSLNQQEMLRILDQIKSGEFETLYISLDVPGFRIRQAPFSRYESAWRDEGDIFLVASLRSFRQETSAYMKLVKRLERVKNESVEEIAPEIPNSETPSVGSNVMKYGMIVVLILMAFIALG
ncbi:hypothetical protein N9448_01970 [Litorivicinus sp.]|nr:hypothetical protein [Litorivicinus sp.]